MVKHRRFSDKPKDDSIQNEEKIESHEQQISSEKTTLDLKSVILSGVKYAYIVAAAALLSGIFAPMIFNVELTTVIFGMLTLFMGLIGGIMILLAIQNQKSVQILIFGGLGMIIASLIIVYELAERSLFQF